MEPIISRRVRSIDWLAAVKRLRRRRSHIEHGRKFWQRHKNCTSYSVKVTMVVVVVNS